MNDKSKPDTQVRERVLQHLRQALAGGAALGTALACAAQDQPPIVCDPLPPPIIRCEGGTLDELGQRLQPQAYWLQEGEARTLHMHVGGWRSEVALGTPTLTGGKFLNAPPPAGATNLDLAIKPAPNAAKIVVALPIPCRGPKAVLHFEISLSAKDDTAPVTVKPGKF